MIGIGRRSRKQKVTTKAASERQRIESRYKPSVRELFPLLRDQLLASRPLVGHKIETYHADGTVTGGEPIYGKPTFRNVIDENGRHV